MTVSPACTMTALGLVMAPEICAGCGNVFARGDQMTAVTDNDTGESLGWFCDRCIRTWNEPRSVKGREMSENNANETENAQRVYDQMTDEERTILEMWAPVQMAREIIRLRAIQRRIVAGLSSPPLRLAELKKQALIEALAAGNGNRVATAKIMGVGVRTVYRMVKQFNLGGYCVDASRRRAK